MAGLFGYGTLIIISTAVATGWRYISTFWAQISSRMIIKQTFTDNGANAVMAYSQHYWSRSRFGPLTYQGWKTFVRPTKEYETVMAETLASGTKLYWHGRWPVWMSRVSSFGGGDNDRTHMEHRPIQLTYIRGTIDPDQLALAASDHFNSLFRDEEENRYYVVYSSGSAGKPARLGSNGVSAANSIQEHSPDASTDLASKRLLRYRHKDLGPIQVSAGNALSLLALSNDQEALVTRVKRWKASKDWFVERGLPWKYGANLYGPPGTGKSCFVRSLAQDLNMPIHQFDLATFFNDELKEQWQMMRSNTPCIALIEDVDAVFDGRKPKGDQVKLSFDALLNVLDGVEQANGLLVFVTTNHVESLDPALGGVTADGQMSTRPGRIDCSVVFNNPTEAGRRHIAKRILKDWPDKIEELATKHTGYSGAQFERACVDLAQELYWNEKEPNESA